MIIVSSTWYLAVIRRRTETGFTSCTIAELLFQITVRGGHFVAAVRGARGVREGVLRDLPRGHQGRRQSGEDLCPQPASPITQVGKIYIQWVTNASSSDGHLETLHTMGSPDDLTSGPHSERCVLILIYLFIVFVESARILTSGST